MQIKRSTWLRNNRFTPPTPPTPPVLQALELTALEFAENTPEGTPIASILGKTLGSALALEQASAWFTISGAQVLKGAIATPDGDYPITIVEALAGATGSPKDNDFTLVATPAAPVGTVSFGIKTRAGHGGVPSNNAPGSVIAGTGASDWRIDAEGDLVPSGTYGAAKTFTRSDYSLTFADASTATVNIIANTAHVKWKNNASLVNVDTQSAFQLRTLTSLAEGVAGALVAGDQVIVRPGVQNNVSTGTLGGLAMRLRPPASGYAGVPGNPDAWVRIIAEDPVDLNVVTSGTCRLTNLGIDSALMTSAMVEVGLSFEGFQCWRPGTGTSGFASAADTNGNKPYRIRFKNLRGWGGTIASAEGLDISSGIYMPTTAEGVIVEDCLFHDMYNPVQIGGRDCIVRRVYMVRAYNDFLKFSAPTGLLVEDIIEIDKRIPVGIGAHGDYNQEDNEGSPLDTTIEGSIWRRIVSATGQTNPVHNQDGGIIFLDDARVSTKLGGVSITQCIGLNRQKNRAYNISNPIDGEMKYLTAIYEPDSTTGSGIIMNGSVDCVIENCIGSTVSHADYTPGAGGGTVPTSGSTVTNCIAYNPTFGKNWATVSAEHAVRHLSPSYGADNGLPADQVPTKDMILAAALLIKQNWSPKVGVAVADGGAMNPDGTYIGALFPKNADGSVDWNDGSVYVPH